MEKVLDLYRNKNKLIIDAFDRIAVSIFMQREKHNQRKFVICGCSPGAGATYISVELAICLAVSGWKTVLIDADLRKEGFYKRLNEQVEIGLSDYISHDYQEEDIIYHTNWKGLDYISSGKTYDETPVKMLYSVKMEKLMKYLEDRYDFLLFDVPSLDSAVDARIVCSKADCTFLVVAAEETTFAELEEAKKQMSNIGAPVLGVIANKISFEEYGKYIKNYNYFEIKRYILNNYYQKKIKEKKNPENQKSENQKFSKFWERLKEILQRGKMIILLFFLIMLQPVDVNAASINQTVETQTEQNSMLPVVMATGYSITEGVCAVDSEYTLNIQIQNLNRYVDAYQLSMTLSTNTEGVYLQQGEINQRYVERLPANGTSKFDIKMVISENVDADAAIIDLRFDYVNENGDVGSNTTTISVEILKSCKLEIVSINASDTVTKGAKTLLNLQYENSGERKISDISMVIEGNIESSGKEVALEVPEPGRQISLDRNIVFTKTGKQKLKIYITYEDFEGLEYTVDPQEISVLVNDSSISEGGSSNISVSKESSSHTKLILSVGAVFIVVAASVLLKIGKKSRKNK